jgi:hypothetical protein
VSIPTIRFGAAQIAAVIGTILGDHVDVGATEIIGESIAPAPSNE